MKKVKKQKPQTGQAKKKVSLKDLMAQKQIKGAGGPRFPLL